MKEIKEKKEKIFNLEKNNNNGINYSVIENDLIIKKKEEEIQRLYSMLADRKLQNDKLSLKINEITKSENRELIIEK